MFNYDRLFFMSDFGRIVIVMYKHTREFIITFITELANMENKIVHFINVLC